MSAGVFLEALLDHRSLLPFTHLGFLKGWARCDLCFTQSPCRTILQSVYWNKSFETRTVQVAKGYYIHTELREENKKRKWLGECPSPLRMCHPLFFIINHLHSSLEICKESFQNLCVNHTSNTLIAAFTFTFWWKAMLHIVAKWQVVPSIWARTISES